MAAPYLSEPQDREKLKLGPFGAHHAGNVESLDKLIELARYNREKTPGNYWLNMPNALIGGALGAGLGGLLSGRSWDAGKGFDIGTGAIAGGLGGLAFNPAVEALSHLKRTYHTALGNTANPKGVSSAFGTGMGALGGAAAGALAGSLYNAFSPADAAGSSAGDYIGNIAKAMGVGAGLGGLGGYFLRGGRPAARGALRSAYDDLRTDKHLGSEYDENAARMEQLGALAARYPQLQFADINSRI